MIEHISTDFTRGELPASPIASEVALEAGVTEAQAQALISAAWEQAETFTGRTYYPVTAGSVVLRVKGAELYTWPRYPFPETLTVEALSGGEWVSHSETYIAGMIELEGPLTYRLTQPDTVTPPTPKSHVLQAVFNLAVYQLVYSPQRREFKSQNAGDSGFTREHLMGLFYGSGAGALLASEVRK
ncbi:hypothetical protein NNA36_06785 [Shimia sp. CNT1-13L.2]|uniref:hypothetical protein n=1 Tax=Shimia sp. CNT1-13L.2 TaxID=2959663 RepID=UPI0020CD8A7F|nr:hypothetical protein [Shimia sp. CNT1-13L.2]MCP9481666.1 hypothetical protein [Shimia sp. CNT1-13L.2]